MDEYNYWVSLYSIIFSVLIASLSLNSTTWIKDKFNKILAFFVFTGLYSFILSYFLAKPLLVILNKNDYINLFLMAIDITYFMAIYI